MTELTETNARTTMSSLELVDYENSFREELARKAGVEFPSKGYAKLSHDDFMRKVPKVLGADAPKFFGTQTYGNNNTRSIYNFPKREACLMAMSYSYELQAKVFDRMAELETGLIAKTKTDPTLGLSKYARIGEALVRAARRQEYDSAKELEDILDKLDFGPAARTEGVSEATIRRRIAMHTTATVRLDHITRGEHAHSDSVRDVVQWARDEAQAEDLQAKLLEHQKREALSHQTLAQIDAYDMIHKHDNPYLPVGPAPRKRALRKQPVRKAK